MTDSSFNYHYLTACPHFQKLNDTFRCLSPKSADKKCQLPRNVRSCKNLIIPTTSFEPLRSFIDTRLDTVYSEKKPYEKAQIANYFAQCLCETLQDEGVDIRTENETDTTWEIPLKSGKVLHIKSDAIVQVNETIKAAIEIKYMERGLYYIPDMKKIAWDYLQFKKNHEPHHFYVISGAKLSSTRDSEHVVRHFSDHTYDLNIWNQRNLDSKIKQLVHDLQHLPSSKKQKVIINNPAKWNPLPTQLRTVEMDVTKLKKISSTSRRGNVLEILVQAHHRGQRIERASRHGQFKSACFCNVPITVVIRVDLCIPTCKNPLKVLECKNIQNLSIDAKSIVFDSWFIRNTYPQLEYEVWLGPHVKKVPRRLLDGEVHSIVKIEPKE